MTLIHLLLLPLLFCTLVYVLTWSRGSVLSFDTQVRGFNPGRSRRVFQGEKNPQHAFLRKVSKAVFSHVVDLRNVKDP